VFHKNVLKRKNEEEIEPKQTALSFLCPDGWCENTTMQKWFL